MSFRFTSLFFVFALAAACSPSSSSGTSNTPCGRYFEALTARAARCGEPTGVEGNSNASARFDAYCANEAASPGATGFTASIDACAQRVAGLSCDADVDCEPTGGTLDPGAPCQESFQCKGYCKHGEGDGENHCGTCAAIVPEGGACESSAACGPNGHCMSGKCSAAPPKAAGEACTFATDCQSGLACIADKCAPHVEIGGKCTSSGDCQNHVAECKEGVCTALATEGQACSFGCAAGLACGADLKCAKPDFVGVGAACDDVHRCQDSICIGLTTNVTSNPNDPSASSVTITPGKCVAPLPDGAACKADDPNASCDLFAECIAGTCQVPNPNVCH